MFRSDDMENLGYFVSNPALDDNDGVARCLESVRGWRLRPPVPVAANHRQLWIFPKRRIRIGALAAIKRGTV
jgi:hypothetical protein